MPAMTNAVAADLVNIQATFNAAMDPASLLPHLWTCAPVNPLLQGAIVKAVVSPAATVVDLLFSPKMIAGQQYTLRATAAKTAGGVVLQPNENTLNFTVPAQAPNPAVLGLPGGNRAAFLQAVGEELQALDGVPVTLLVSEFPDSAQVLLVESTLGFPASGRLWLDGQKYTYSAKTAASFHGVTPVYPVLPKTVPPRAVVTLDQLSVGLL